MGSLHRERRFGAVRVVGLRGSPAMRLRVGKLPIPGSIGLSLVGAVPPGEDEALLLVAVVAELLEGR